MWDLFDWVFDRPTWRRMHGPQALAAAILGTFVALMPVALGTGMFLGATSWQSKLVGLAVAAVGIGLLASTVMGVIAFLRAGDSDT